MNNISVSNDFKTFCENLRMVKITVQGASGNNKNHAENACFQMIMKS